jgi:tryptophanyl-tRNA synthetase
MTARHKDKPRIFSGIQPTGKLHLGNYIGALVQWVANQDRYECIYSIVDLHALTAWESDRAVPIREKVRQTAALLIACGLDPDRSALFVQSQVPAHAELAWILNCLTPVGWLERMTQYKAKAARAEQATAGLLDYPVLQAADILLYRTDLVPVGEDQKQHIELTADIARRFNRIFGEVFVIPKPLIRPTGARIMGLDDPSIKMSKSLAEGRKGHAIGLADPPDEIRRIVSVAVTDSDSETLFDFASPGVRNLLTIFEALSGKPRRAIESHFEGKGYRYLKAEVADLIIAVLDPIRARYQPLMNDSAYLDKLLQQGAERVRPVAFSTLEEVKRRIGIENDASEAMGDLKQERGKRVTSIHIVMYTRVGCEDSDAAREFLKQRHIPFEEVDIDKSREALEFVMRANHGKQRTPTFDVDGRTFHCSPFDPRKLARELGLPVETPVGRPKAKTA